MRDFLPAQKHHRERVLEIIRGRYRAHGFDEIETPVVEDYGRLHAGVGGDNEKLGFSVLRRGLDAESIRAAADRPEALSDLGLRYDLTVPLARFYATHRAELPGVFRAIQIGPVWRAERPQKGRFRQFVQCDIDIIGDASARAEAELLVATLDAIGALGLAEASIRINDRRILDWMLDTVGVAPPDRPGALIALDKLDKVGSDGVLAELHERGIPVAAVTALEDLLRRAPGTASGSWRDAVAAALPSGAPADLVDHLDAVASAVRAGSDRAALVFDPFLVRGMGYYTGTIFELAHPAVGYSLGGGGRYDGMIGRFLGTDVPAVGFSIGFERIVDLVGAPEHHRERAVVLVHDQDVPLEEVVAAKTELLATCARIRVERRPRNLKGLLAQAAADGYTHVVNLPAGSAPGSIAPRPLSPSGGGAGGD